MWTLNFSRALNGDQETRADSEPAEYELTFSKFPKREQEKSHRYETVRIIHGSRSQYQ